MKTKFFLPGIIFLLCFTWKVSAQNDQSAVSASIQNNRNMQVADKNTRDASFPGLSRYLSDSLRYPEIARENCVEGYVVAEATIKADGSVSAPKIVERLGFGCDEAVLSLLSAMPGWEPAMKNGQAEEQKVRLRVQFRMQ